ncbi:hypothetical protein ULMS_25390 [Patiriisocius marinistellae]|uniref:histidine kinase n=1 Tax=Patiriisocius marinistellae TaxID=2494560 RepID=A0A5J4G3S0_9FLAO|nr:GAF domain-containing sensor histidine kinase [Patiriisocius marinistellae]GEQ87031.1 hypothetical protein ULMS_25390 [Patiriisocius marinistellae]
MNKEETLNIQIQNRLVEQLTVSNRELKLINAFTQDLQSTLNTSEVIDLLADNFKAYFNHFWCEVYLMDDDKKRLIRINPDSEMIKNHDVICYGKGLIGEVAKSGVAEIKTHNAFMEGELKPFFKSEIAVPLVHNGKDVVGVIYSRHIDFDFFNQNQIKTILTITSIAASKVLQTENLAKIENYQTQLEEYVHIVSHDLKSPLRSINALISWIKEDNKDSLNFETIKNFELIDATLFQMDNLITNTLKYSKIGYDVYEEDDEVDLNAVIKDIEKTLQIDEHISFSVPQQLPVIQGNRTKFMQIFQNLIENAIKYCDKSKGLILLTYTVEAEYYTFSLQDNGVGIQERYFDKIFQIFQTLNDQKDSSGVGLSIVKKLINNYGGKIWLKSQVDFGTTFFFTLRKT